MSRFVQLHLLTNYPPSNLNRDDAGRPKRALMGNAARLRISSQSQKRAWRESELFADSMAGNLGMRTKELGREVYNSLLAAKIGEKDAREWAKKIAQQFGKLKSAKKTDKQEDLQIEQLAHISPAEWQAVQELVQTCSTRQTEPSEQELKLLRVPSSAVDVAMFGRMLASNPEYNMEAAIQVAHAITVHKCNTEDDYFTAVDDVTSASEHCKFFRIKGEEDKTGAGHIGERSFGAGLFYTYICIDRKLLKANLNNNEELYQQALQAFMHAVTQVSPKGMQNSFASRSYASFVLAEKGNDQPRTLAQAFLKPVGSGEQQGEVDMLQMAVAALEKRRMNFNKIYGQNPEDRSFNVETGEGSLADVIQFVRD